VKIKEDSKEENVKVLAVCDNCHKILEIVSIYKFTGDKISDDDIYIVSINQHNCEKEAQDD